LLPCFGAILNHGPKLVQYVQTLIDLTLRIGRIRTLLRCRSLSGNACVAGVPPAAVAVSAALGVGIAGSAASDSVANRTSLAGRLTTTTALAATTLAGTALLSLALLPGLATLSLLPTSATLSLLALALPLTLPLTRLATLARLLTGLAALASLTGLPVAAELAGLKLLLATALALLTLALAALASLTIGLSTKPGELIPQTRYIVHCSGECGVLRSVLRASYGANRLAHPLPQLLQIVGKRGFGRIGEISAAQPVRAALHPHPEIALVRAIDRASQLRGCRRLRGRKFARRRSELLLEARKIVAHLLAIIDHLVDISR
jgi:hypothetical protein